MNARVRQFWIEGVLDRQLYRAAIDEIAGSALPDAVEHPWERILELPGHRPSVVPENKSVRQLFDEANRALLILGEPGSGKTTTMLQLARGLVESAEQDPAAPVPVVLNLSTWTASFSMQDWIIDELKSKYYVPERQSRAWIEAHRLLLLLDGLDEVGSEQRTFCVMAINRFVEETGVPGIVVCSRMKEYVALPARLRLHGAVRLQPLSFEQVNQYLTRNEQLSALRSLLHSSPVLQEMAQNPLMLNVMSLAYQNGDRPATIENSHRPVKHLFDTYIKRMFERRGKAMRPFEDEQTVHWLSWMARKLQRHAESVLMVEQLQPSWLDSSRQRHVYILLTRLLSGAAVGMCFGLTLDLTTGIVFGAGPAQLLNVAFGIWFGLLFGISGGLVIATLDIVRLARGGRLLPVLPGGAFTEALVYALLLSAAGGLLVASIDGFRSAGFGMLLGLGFGMFFGLRNSTLALDRDIRTVEALNWSWKNALRGGARGSMAGALLGLMIGVIAAGDDLALSLILTLLYTVLMGAAGAVPGVLFSGLGAGILKTKTVPNQGMHLSARNAVLGGAVIGLAGCLPLLVVTALIWGLQTGLVVGLLGGSLLAFLAGLWYGGLELLHHATLRWLLRRNGLLPPNLGAFLDHSTRLIFLQKAGGGYMFVHRTLQEHFADLHQP